MRGPPQFVVRKCCPGGTRTYIEPAAIEDSMAYRFSATDAPVIDHVDPSPPDERVAYHEAGHAVIAHAMGTEISMVTVGLPAHVAYSGRSDLLPVQEVARSFAGPVGEMIRMRCFGTVSQDDESDFLRRVEAFQFGGCDECRMAMASWAAVGLPAGIEAARGVFREGQLLALRLGQRRDVQQAVRAVAAELMREPTLSGKRCHSVIEPLVKFNSLVEEIHSC